MNLAVAQTPTQLARRAGRRTKVGLVAGGLGAYWPQFPALLPQLQRCARRVAERVTEMDCDVVDVGFISDAQQGAALRARQLITDIDVVFIDVNG